MFSTLKDQLEKDLDKALVHSNVLLSRFTMLAEDTRLAPAYIDPRNFPFYYHLGKYINPKRFLEVGFDLGFRSGCFLKSCKTVEKFTAIEGQTQNQDYYNARLGIKNIKCVYRKEFNLRVEPLDVIPTLLTDPVDFAIVNEEMNYDQYRNLFDAILEVMSLDGLLVVGFLNDRAKEAFDTTAKVANREYFTINTRYGTGIIKK